MWSKERVRVASEKQHDRLWTPIEWVAVGASERARGDVSLWSSLKWPNYGLDSNEFRGDDLKWNRWMTLLSALLSELCKCCWVTMTLDVNWQPKCGVFNAIGVRGDSFGGNRISCQCVGKSIIEFVWNLTDKKRYDKKLRWKDVQANDIRVNENIMQNTF